MTTAPAAGPAAAKPAAAVMCSTQRSLLDVGARCASELDRFPGEQAEHHRARTMLTALAKSCRTAAAVFDLDPTLAGDPYGTGRFRALDLLAELARQTRTMLTMAGTDRLRGRRSAQDCWAEAEALFDRAMFFAERIPAVVRRRDHASEAGSRAISRERLATHADELTRAAETVRHAVADALRLPHPDPDALALAALADRLIQQAAELAEQHAHQVVTLSAALGLPGHADPEPLG